MAANTQNNWLTTLATITILGFIASGYLILVDYLGTYASNRFFGIGLILLSVFPLIILLFTIYADNERKLFMLLLLFLPLIPSVGGYLEIIGGPIMVISIEVFAVIYLFISCLGRIQVQTLGSGLTIFILLWLIGNFLPFAFSLDLMNSLPMFLLSVFVVIPWMLVLNSEFIDEGFIRRRALPIFCFSITIFCLFTFLISLLTNGFAALNIASLGRLAIPGPGYLTNNASSGLAITALPISYVLLRASLQEGKLVHSFLYLACLIIPLFLILVDKSRSAALVLILLVLILVMSQLISTMKKRESTRVSFKSRSMMFFVALLLLSGIYLASESFIVRFAGSRTNFDLAEIVWNSLVSSRGAILLNSWNEFLSSPIYGKGYGNNLVYIPEFGKYWNAHNMILEQLCTTGIIGTLPVIYIIFLTFKTFISNLKNINLEIKALASAIAISIIGLLLFGSLNGLELIAAYDIKSSLPMMLLLFLSMILIKLCNQSNHQKHH